MNNILGIDLGTTNSCTAVPGARTGSGFLQIRECPGVSIVLDQMKSATVPSIVAADETGKILVGLLARMRIGRTPSPIMFSKRAMGKNVRFPLGQGTATPEEAAAHILRYLKQCAEERLGTRVDQAVITVPAYFDLYPRNMTEKAAELAGLKVVQILQEPVAAAIMYCAHDPRDPLLIMTYDLGGGTFDVSVLEKRNGIISSQSIRAFDGDPTLGGYNFDRRIVFWIAKQFERAGLRINLDDPVLFAQLMLAAEKAKIQLTHAETAAVELAGVRFPPGSPKPPTPFTLRRDVFEDLIREFIDETIRLCKRALKVKAYPEIRPEQLQEIVLVGGSSRIPLVARQLEATFGLKPKLILPDLCVALGAGIVAGTFGSQHGIIHLDRVPESTDLPSVAISGGLKSPAGNPIAPTTQVRLRHLDSGSDWMTGISAKGDFAFDDIPLKRDTMNSFRLEVLSVGGGTIAHHDFAIKQTQESASELVPVGNVLAKALFLETRQGWREVIKERTPLPASVEISGKTSDASGLVRIPIIEENKKIGEFVISGIPKDLPIGSGVSIRLLVTERYSVEGQASIPQISRSADLRIDLTPLPMRTPIEMKTLFAELQKRAEQLRAKLGRDRWLSDPHVLEMCACLEECERMLAEPMPDLFRLQERLNQLDTVLRLLDQEWVPNPSTEAFAGEASSVRELVAKGRETLTNFNGAVYEAQLEAIVNEGEQAFRQRSPALWHRAVVLLQDLGYQLHILTSGRPVIVRDIDPKMYVTECRSRFATLREYALSQEIYDDFAGDFASIDQQIARLEAATPAPSLAEVADLMTVQIPNLVRKVSAIKDKQGLVVF